MKRLLKCIYAYVALGLLIIAFVLACFCYHTVNSDSYHLFWEEYSDAATSRWEYQQAARAATNATEKSYYEDWADFYDNLEDSWWRRIQETKTKAKIYGLFAGTCGLLGFAFMIPAYLEIKKSNTPVKQAIPHGFCRACGTPLNPGSRFCGICGSKIWQQ